MLTDVYNKTAILELIECCDLLDLEYFAMSRLKDAILFLHSVQFYTFFHTVMYNSTSTKIKDTPYRDNVADHTTYMAGITKMLFLKLLNTF